MANGEQNELSVGGPKMALPRRVAGRGVKNQRRSPASRGEGRGLGFNLRLWVTMHLAVIALAVFSWAWCLQLFSTPEQPGHYGFLRQIGRLPELAAFSPFDIPPGESCPPNRLHQRCQGLADETASALSRQWLRDYLTNYGKAERRLYLVGDYRIIGARRLAKDDPIQPGLLVTLQAQMSAEANPVQNDYPVVLHWLIPGEKLDPDGFVPDSSLTLTKAREAITPLGVQVVHHPQVNFPTVHVSVISLTYNGGQQDLSNESEQGRNNLHQSTPPKHLALRFPWPHQRMATSN